jgi:integral membrane protein
VSNPVAAVRRLGWIEGVSFLVLLGVAMPLKYFAGLPRAVTWFGWAHGVLFVALCWALWRTRAVGWDRRRMAKVFVAALLPFGPFVLDRRLRAWEAEAGRLPAHR